MRVFWVILPSCRYVCPEGSVVGRPISDVAVHGKTHPHPGDGTPGIKSYSSRRRDRNPGIPGAHPDMNPFTIIAQRSLGGGSKVGGYLNGHSMEHRPALYETKCLFRTPASVEAPTLVTHARCWSFDIRYTWGDGRRLAV